MTVSRGRSRRLVRQALIYAGLCPFVIVALFPVYWMAITAFKQNADLYRMDHIPLWFNLAPTLEHFRVLFTETQYATWVVNTITVAGAVVLLTLATAVPAGYALARLRLPGAENTGIAIFATYLVPAIILFLPLARVVGASGLQDSRWALVMLYPTFTIPFCTWIMMGFFRTVPMEIEEAAWVDGCGTAGGLWRIVLPVSRPGILITAIFTFTLSMQEFLYGAVFVSPTEEKVVTVGVPTMLIRGDIYYWGSLMAGALLVGLPVAILFGLFIDRFIQGLTGGAIR